MSARILVPILAMSIACSTACNRSTDMPPRAPGGSGSTQIVYHPNVHVIEKREGLRALSGVSSDGTALLFRNNAQIAGVKNGDVLLIQGALAKKVVASRVQGQEVLLLTQPARITDVIKQGTIRVNAPIRFGRVKSAWNESGDSLRLLSSLIPSVHAQSPEGEILNKAQVKGTRDAYKNAFNSITGAVYKGWTTNFSAEPSDGRLNLHLTMTRDVGGFRAIITGEGYLADFQFSSDIDVGPSTWTQEAASVVQNLKTSCKNMNGIMNFKWEVAKDSPGAQAGDDRIKLPAVAEIPLYQYLDGLPLFLEISSALIIKPAISGGKEYSRGAFRITYNGYQNFQMKEGNADANGNVTGDIQFLESQNISALAPMGMVVAFAAPRIELSLGTTKMFASEADEFLKDSKEIHEAIQGRASYVDNIAKAAGTAILGKEGYEKLKDINLGEALENATKSDATAYVEVVSSSGMSFSGMSSIFPCTRTDIHLALKAGADAQVFGQKVGSTEKELYNKSFSRIDPPGTRLCEGPGG